jgi:hypothetical protein
MSEACLRPRARLAVVLALQLAAPLGAQARPPTVVSEKSTPISVVDSKVIDEINFARTRPGAYAELLRMTPGTPAAQEAIGLLQHRMPVEPLTLNDKLLRGRVETCRRTGRSRRRQPPGRRRLQPRGAHASRGHLLGDHL